MNLREKLPQYLTAVPDQPFDWTKMPLGGIPSLGIPGFSPGFAPTYKLLLDIPGVPRLISRGKDHFLTNWMIDHFGLVFATGPNGMPLSDDVTFELQADTNHEHTPMPYQSFPKGRKPVYIYNIKFDSKAKVIERLERFFKDPKRYRFWFYNCEDFAREIMTGIPQCQQRDKVIETSKIIVEVAGQVLLKMAELEQQRRAAEEEAKRRQAAGAAATAQAQVTPAPAAPSAQQPAPLPIAAASKPKVVRKPMAERLKAAPKSRKKAR